MALVAYDNSDSSEFEDDENENITSAILKSPQEKDAFETPPAATIDSTSENTPNLFNLLPQPSSKKPAVVEEDDEFLHKKEKVPDVIKPKAKITVPSLSDFKDVESPTPAAKAKLPSAMKSGLLGLLPQPKNGLTSTFTSKAFVPHVLTKTNTSKKAPIPSSIKKARIESKQSINDYSDDSDDDQVENDFFSFNKPIPDLPIDEMAIDQEGDSEVSIEPPRSKLESYFKKDPVVEPEEISEPMESYDQYVVSEAGSSNGHMEEQAREDIVLDEEAILKLCGARGKRRREEIQIVDVNQQEVLAEAKEWLMKGLMDDTSKRMSSSKKKGNEPTNQQKRKHQITYLAHQAKANEAELQNQWANSRMSRRQTQNKYGF